MAAPNKTINQIVGAIDPAIVAFALQRAPERPLPERLNWSDQEGMVSFLQRLTMFAAMAFDPRLIWDAVEQDHARTRAKA